jgi:hypothetical protein
MSRIKAASALVLWIILGGALSPESAWAQIRQGFALDLYLGASIAQGGIMKMLDNWEERYIESTIAKKGLAAGLRGVIHVSPRFGLEFGFGASTNRYRANLYHGGTSRDETNSAILGFLSMNAIGYLATQEFAPYVTAGIGCVAFSEKAVFGYNFGGGAKIFLNPRFALDVDIRYFPAVLKNNLEEMGFNPVGWGAWEYGVVKEPYEDRIDPFHVTVGFCFFLGRWIGR